MCEDVQPSLDAVCSSAKHLIRECRAVWQYGHRLEWALRFSKMIFSKVYFPKVYLPKVYFSKCINQNCINETAVRQCGHGLALRFTNVYFPKCTFQKRIFQKFIFQSVCQKQKLNCTVAVRARIVMGIEGYQSVFFKVHYPKVYSP